MLTRGRAGPAAAGTGVGARALHKTTNSDENGSLAVRRIVDSINSQGEMIINAYL